MVFKRYYSRIEFTCLITGLILTIVAFVLFAGNNANPDYQNYYQMYQNGVISIEDGLLKTLISFCFMKLGFPYQAFHGLIAVFCIFLMWKIVNYYSDGNSLVFLLYLVYPFLLDIVQIDNTMAYMVVLYALRFLDDEDHKKGAITYTGFILLAALIHPIAFVYLLFLLKYVKSEKKLGLTVAGICVFIYFSGGILPKVLKYIPFFNRFTNQLGYYLSWVSEYDLNLKNGMYMFFVLGLACYFFSRLKYKKLLRLKVNSERDDTIIRLMLIVLCFIPLIIISSEFTRVIRNVWILYYCFWLDGKVVGKKYLFITGAVALSIFLFFKDLGPNAYYFEQVTCQIFEKNIFFN